MKIIEKYLDYFNDNFIAFIRFFVYATITIHILIKTEFKAHSNKLAKIKATEKYDLTEIENKFISFEGFNNEIGCQDQIVPNIIHYVNLKQNDLKFTQFLSIVSAWLNHKPDYIYLHCDDCEYIGKYWHAINRTKDLKSIIRIKKIRNLNMKIFNQEAGFIQHKSDVLRILVLMNYGGIYLDNDVLVINSLDKYRKFEMSVSWDSDADGIGNQVLIANQNARLLKAMFDGYRDNYNASLWYYNGGFYPAKILLKNRYLAHSVKYYLGTQMLIGNLYKTKNWKQWKTMDTIHLLINHRDYLDKESKIKQFDEKNIQNYEFTFGEIARDILNRSEILI